MAFLSVKVIISDPLHVKYYFKYKLTERNLKKVI